MQIFVTVISAIVGMSACAGYLFVFRNDLARLPAGAPPAIFSLAQQRFMESFVILLTAAGTTGTFLYRVFKLERHAHIVQQSLGTHASAVKLVCAVAMLASVAIRAHPHRGIPPSEILPIGVAVMLIASAVVSWLRTQLPAPDAELDLIECPCCKVPSDSLKDFEVFNWCIFFGFLLTRSENVVACPKCMRSTLWRRCFKNIATANLAWPLWVLPRTLLQIAGTYIRGRSQSLEVEAD